MGDGTGSPDSDDRPGLKYSQKIGDANEGFKTTTDQDQAAFARQRNAPSMNDVLNNLPQDKPPKVEPGAYQLPPVPGMDTTKLKPISEMMADLESKKSR